MYKIGKFWKKLKLPKPPTKEVFNKKNLYPILLVVLLAAGSATAFFFGTSLVQAWRAHTAAAVVNGEVISKTALERRLIQTSGTQVVQQLIDEALILQEGRKQKISITDQDLKAKLSEVEKLIAPSSIDDALKAQKLTRDDLDRDLRIQIITEKILGADLDITEADIKDYFDKNKTTLAQDLGKKPEDLKLEDARQSIVSELTHQRISAKYRPWVENLRSQSKIETFLTT
jgi:foldase protein PrsA